MIGAGEIGSVAVIGQEGLGGVGIGRVGNKCVSEMEGRCRCTCTVAERENLVSFACTIRCQ